MESDGLRRRVRSQALRVVCLALFGAAVLLLVACGERRDCHWRAVGPGYEMQVIWEPRNESITWNITNTTAGPVIIDAKPYSYNIDQTQEGEERVPVLPGPEAPFGTIQTTADWSYVEPGSTVSWSRKGKFFLKRDKPINITNTPRVDPPPANFGPSRIIVMPPTQLLFPSNP